MGDVSIVVPRRDPEPCEWRRRAWSYVGAHYAEHHPAWELIEGVCLEGVPWSKGAAVADGVARASGDVLIIADADSYVSPEGLSGAAQAALTTGWAQPHGKVFRLNQATTERLYAGIPGARKLARATYEGPLGGGIVAITRAGYETVNGFDVRFLGWGGEDVSFGMAARTLIGFPEVMGVPLTHLWHPHPAPNLRGSPESEALVAQYVEALHRPRLMRALVEHREPEPPRLLDRPVVFRAGYPNRIFKMGGTFLRFRNFKYETRDPDEIAFLSNLDVTREN